MSADASSPALPGPGARSLALVGILLALAVYLVGLGATPVQCGNEAMYLYPPISMLRTGDFLVPRYMHGPFLDKPPLTFWLVAASYRLFGVSTAAGRLPAALAALATAAVVGLWVRRRSGDLAAVFALLFLAFSFKFAVFARQFAADAFLALAVTLAVIALEEASRRGDVSDLRSGALAGLALALAFSFKGLIGVVLPLGAVGLGLLFDGVRPIRFSRRALAALVIFLAALLPWHWAMTQRLGLEFWRYFYVSNQLLRGASNVFTGHSRGPLYYVGVLAWGAFPWILFVPPVLRRQRPTSTPPGWLVFGALFLSALVMKREVYAMPLFPAVAVLAGEHLARSGRPPFSWRRLGWLAASLVSLAAIVLWWRMGPSLRELVGGPAHLGLGAGLALLLSSALLGAARPAGAVAPLLCAAACGATMLAVLNVEVRISRYDPLPEWGERVGRLCTGACETYRLGLSCNSVDYYSRREWVDLQDARELKARLPPEGGFLIARTGLEGVVAKTGVRTHLLERRPRLEQSWAAAGLSGKKPEFVSLSLLRVDPPSRASARAEPEAPAPSP